MASNGDNVSDETPNKAKKRKGQQADGCSGSGSKIKKRSWVWQHFTEQKEDEDKANFNHCGKEMIVPSASVLMCLEQWLKCEIKMNEKRIIRKEQMLADFELQDELMREFEPVFHPVHPQ